MLAQVTRVQPALRVQRLLRLVGHIEVTHKDVASPEADLAVSLLVFVVQLCFAPWELDTAAAREQSCNSPASISRSLQTSNQCKEKNVPGELEGIVAGDGVRAAALAHAVQFAQRNVEAEEELQGVFGDGGGACVALGAAVQAQGLTHLFEHKLFGYVIADRSAAWCRIPGEKE